MYIYVHVHVQYLHMYMYLLKNQYTMYNVHVHVQNCLTKCHMKTMHYTINTHSDNTCTVYMYICICVCVKQVHGYMYYLI